MVWLQAVAIGLIALILTPGWLFYFDVTAKVVVLLAAAAILLPFTFRGRRPSPAVAIIAMLYVLSLTLSSLHSSNPALSWFGTNWRRYGALAQIAVLLFAWSIFATGFATNARRAILRAISLATSLAAVYGIAQYAGFDPVLPGSIYHVGEGVWSIVRPPATFGYVSYFATWLVMAAFLGLAVAEMEDSRPWRWAALGSSGLAVIAMLLTGTRAAMLGLAAGGVLWLFRRGFRLRARTLGLAAAIALALAAFYFSPAGWQLRSRARWFAEDPWGGARLTLWRDSLAMGLRRPLLGYGPEMFTGEFPHFESPGLARAYTDFAHESPHNIFLDALISQGLPGLLLLAAFLAVGFRTRDPALAAALCAGIVSQQFTVFTVPTAVLTWVTLALALPAAAPSEGIERSGIERARRPVFVLIPVSLALLYCALRLTVADAALALAQNELRRGDARAADMAYARYDRWRLPGTSASLWYSRTLLELSGRTADPAQRIQVVVRAATAGLQAVTSAEDPCNAWFNLAQLAASRNDAPGAERALRQAIAANPNWFKSHWSLARLLALEGRSTEARAEAARAVWLDGGKHTEVEQSVRGILNTYPNSPPLQE
jgi:O-antigen ligase